MFVLLLLILPGMRSQEAESDSYLEDRNYQYQPYNSVQFMEAKPTKKGPILFPNDAPPPPAPPLIVTSRPLSESIARSELNPNNSQAAQSQLNQVSYRPQYLSRVKNYKPFAYTLATVTPAYDFGSSQPYADSVKIFQGSRRDNFYNEYEQRLIRPLYQPSDHDHKEQKPLPKLAPIKYQQRFKKINRYEPQPAKSPDFNDYNTNEGERDNSKDYNQGDNYAFSYTVKDDKTGDDFSHSQQSTGSATNGEYRVRLPDGRMQVVSYTADENGYKADVRYDEQHNDNSIDLDASKENRNRNDLLIPYKHNNAYTTNVNIDGRDSTDNGAYLQHRYKVDKSHNYNNDYSKRPKYYSTHHDLSDDFLKNTNDFDHKNDFTDTTKVLVYDQKSGALTDSNNDYLNRYNDKDIESNDKVLRVHDDDDYQINDEVPLSKEVIDYSSEFNHGYEPYKSKYSSFNNPKRDKSTVVPSYEELKDLFVTNPNGRQQNSALPVVSTVRPNYNVATDDVVVIGGKKPNLYTNIRNIVPVTPAPLTYSTPYASTPSGYLLSTITNLKNQINLVNKPVLSNQYIDKINKYLTYK